MPKRYIPRLRIALFNTLSANCTTPEWPIWAYQRNLFSFLLEKWKNVCLAIEFGNYIIFWDSFTIFEIVVEYAYEHADQVCADSNPWLDKKVIVECVGIRKNEISSKVVVWSWNYDGSDYWPYQEKTNETKTNFGVLKVHIDQEESYDEELKFRWNYPSPRHASSGCPISSKVIDQKYVCPDTWITSRWLVQELIPHRSYPSELNYLPIEEDASNESRI